MSIETNKERFLSLLKTHVNRSGIEKLIDFLCDEKQSDFFRAPASTRFHGNYEGGLCEHSLHVYDCLKAYLSRERVRDVYHLQASDETIAIVALLHDICKTNVYKESTRNVKKDGQWIQVPFYEFDDALPYGHGEKSVYMISSFIKLTREEAFAIRYHMGFSSQENVGNVGKAFEMFPLAFATATADMEATYFLDKTVTY